MPKVEVKLEPVENFTGAIDTTVTEETKQRFLHLGELAGMVEGIRRKNHLKFGTALILAAVAATEISKEVFPLISPDLTPLNNHVILSQLSAFSESPLGAGLIAAIGTYYLAKSAFRDRAILSALKFGLRKTRIHPVDIVEPIDDDRDNE